MSFLKPKPAKSYNTNEKLITGAYGGQIGQGTGATNFLAQLLGVSPGGVSSAANAIGGVANGVAEAGGAQAGFQGYLKNAGYQNVLSDLMRGITGGAAAQGTLRSGGTGRAYLREGTKLNQGMFENYLAQLSGLSGLGLQAGGLVSNVGQRQSGSRPSTAGSIASTIGGIASIFSDRRLKTAIEKVGELDDGLGVYLYRYIGEGLRRIGVMAHEVAALRPWALGPRIGGFATVNYEAL